MNIFSASNDAQNDGDEVDVGRTEEVDKKEVRYMARKSSKKSDEVSGNIKEELKVQSSVRNPYYASSIEGEPLRTERSRRSQNSAQAEIISCTSNVYYDM